MVSIEQQLVANDFDLQLLKMESMTQQQLAGMKLGNYLQMEADNKLKVVLYRCIVLLEDIYHAAENVDESIRLRVENDDNDIHVLLSIELDLVLTMARKQ
jgi:hypothetical protein